MTDSLSIWLLALLLIAVVAAWPKVGLWAQWQRRRTQSDRALLEDALKHIVTSEHRGQRATPESLAGALARSERRILSLVLSMEKHGLVRSQSGGLALTREGESWALQVIRAHRLWETYLTDDAGMPMERVHQAAEIAEHQLSPERLDRLEAHLGHPASDPHGDPIPTAEGTLRHLDAVSLTDWPDDTPARIVHIEDEPDAIFRQIIAAGLRPGSTIRILENTPERLVIFDGDTEHRLAHVVAANVQVAEARHTTRSEGALRLSQLKAGQVASVIELDPECRGFSRRRLLDLGLTPEARVEVALDNPFGDPRGFRVRGTTIALRNQQADQVWIHPLTAASQDQPVAEEQHA